MADSDGKVTLACRATDESYSTQPEDIKDIWNMRGFLCNSYHTITIEVHCPKARPVPAAGESHGQAGPDGTVLAGVAPKQL